MEVFDPQTNTLTVVASMSTTRTYFSLTTVRGKLYAVGGFEDFEGEITLATVEAYDPQQNRWKAMAPMPDARYSHGATAVCV